MPNISRGQVITQNPQQDVLEFAMRSAQQAAQLLQQRKALDQEDERLKQGKWVNLHNSLMELMKNDAMTNAAGWRGAFENFRGSLEGLYSVGGMHPDTVRTLFNSIEASGLDPQVLANYSYSRFLTGDLGSITSAEVTQGLEETVKRMALAPEGGYPEQVVTVGGVVEEPPEAPTPPGPPAKTIEEMQKRGEREAIERKIGEPKGRLPFTAETLERAGIQLPSTPPPTPPTPPKMKLINERRPMNEVEKEAYRRKLAETMPEKLAGQFAEHGVEFSQVVENWVRTGEITIKEKGKVAQYTQDLKKVLQTPSFTSKLKQEYETPDETGLTKLQKVLLNLGAVATGGVQGTPQQRYFAGAQFAAAMLNPSALQAHASSMEAMIGKERWEANRAIKIPVRIPPTPDGRVYSLDFNQFIAYSQVMASLMSLQGEGGSPLGDMTFQDVHQAMREMEKAANINPGDTKFEDKRARLMEGNRAYKELTTLWELYVSLMHADVDEEGNPIAGRLYDHLYKFPKSVLKGGSILEHIFGIAPGSEVIPGMRTPYPEEEPSIKRGEVPMSPEEREFRKRYELLGTE